MKKITIATRQSALALWQAEHVQKLLQNYYPELEVNILGFKTTGDKILDVSLAKIGGKGLFTKELEKALLDKKADIAVHSVKDMPAVIPPGLALGPILDRVHPFDVLVSQNHCQLMALPSGAIVGTSSLRRQVQLKAARPDLKYEFLRGNIQTRLKKLEDGQYDAIVVAQAGLERLGLTDHISEVFKPDIMLPAVGQGALGIEFRDDAEDVAKLLSKLEDKDTADCVLAERAMNAKLGGSCQVPIAGFAVLENNQLVLEGRVGDLSGKILRSERQGPRKQAKELGIQVAEDLLAQGAGAIINGINGT